MARAMASWLSGPPQPPQSGRSSAYPGEALGLPESGPGS
ncbi:MAG TPA: RDD family protein, partial [Mycobacterium sp.]|nr:RDD family protein [Mycobacterium sp.]